MKKYIELVKRWLTGEDAIKKRFRNNRVAAHAAYTAAVAEATTEAVAVAAEVNTASADAAAAHWVTKYEELTK